MSHNHRKEIRELEGLIEDITATQTKIPQTEECICHYDMAISMLQARHYKISGRYYTPRKQKGGAENERY